MEKYIYELKMKVRDYECDLQGIVNNANYQHYLEHTRHEFLTSEGISFAKLHEEGIDPVVARITMAYKTPLRSGDEFISKLYLKKEGINKVGLQAFKTNERGNRFWRGLKWTERTDLNYYDLSLNDNNITTFNE